MIRVSTLLERDGVVLSDVACRHGRGRGSSEERGGDHLLVLVRRGCFVRSADGVERVHDPTTAYAVRPGEEERYDHPHVHGDDCTAVALAPELLASVWGGEPELPSGLYGTSPSLDLEHRLLLAAARRGDDPHDVVERAIAVVAGVLEGRDPGRVDAGRPATARARAALADAAREALAADPDRPLPGLARELAVSPHHLSRAFTRRTGHSIARHRMRLRARAALERLAGGERHLARLAADLGFADQSHLCRVLRAETGRTPSALRHALA